MITDQVKHWQYKLLCKPFTTASCIDVFKLLDELLDILEDNGIDVCTDEAKSLTSKMSGADEKIK